MTNDEGLQRIEKALAGLGSEHVPREGWEARVLDEIRQSPTRDKRPINTRLQWLRRAATVAAAAAGLIVMWKVTRPGPFSGDVAIRSGRTQAMRSLDKSAQLGDIAKVTVTGGEHRAVWIYHHEELRFTCPGERRPVGATCSEPDEDKLTAEMPLALPGDYKILMLAGDEPLPEPTGLYDSDHAAAEKAGAKIKRDAFIVP